MQCMSIWGRRMTGLRWNKISQAGMGTAIIDHALKKFGEDWSCHHGQISRGVPKERAISYQHCLPRPCPNCLRPDKASNIQLMKCLNPFHLPECCILTKFRFVIESKCFFPNISMFLCRKHIMQCINAPASRDSKLDFQLLTYVSSSHCSTKTVGLISIRFTGIDHLHTLYTPKTYANWMSAWSWFLCLKRPLLLHA